MLESVDLDAAALQGRDTRRVFPPLQERLRAAAVRSCKDAEIPTDRRCSRAGTRPGKGTVIQRLTEKLDPRAFRAYPGAPPSELEQRYHFLWRYQTRLPEDGQMALFDHSWYGRVLVERVEKLVEEEGTGSRPTSRSTSSSAGWPTTARCW